MKSIDKHSLLKVDCEIYSLNGLEIYSTNLGINERGNVDSFKPFQLYLHVLIFTTSVITLRSAVITMLCLFVITIGRKFMYC